MAFSQVTVTRSYGAGATGTVSFLPDQPISNGTDYAGSGSAIVATLDGSGNISVAVPSNLDAGTRPAGSRTRVHERINGGNHVYYVQIPTSGPVDLAAFTKSDDSGASVSASLVTPYLGYGPGLLLPGARPPRNAKVITTFQSGHGFSNNAGGSANLNATDQYILGTQYVSATTDGAGTAKTIKRTGMTAIDATGLMPRLWLKVDDQTNLSQLQLYLGDTNLTNQFVWGMQASSSPLWLTPGDWHAITLNWNEATTVGSPTRSAITDAQIRIQDNASGAITVRMNGITLVPEPTAWPNGVASLTFDDTYASQYTQARAKMDQYGFSGTAYVIQDVIGTSNCMTLAQLHLLEEYSGWEVAGHATTGTVHNNRFTSLTTDQLDAEFRGIRSFLSVNQFRGDHLAFPGGQFDNNVLAAADRYFTGARLVFQKPETLPPARRSKLRSMTQASPSKATATIQAEIDAAYAGKQWLIMTFHDIVTTASASTDYSIANFGTVIDYLATKGIPVRTVGEVLATKP